ncbi:MAG: DNA polymerase III subunit alpha, partial [Nitriliruptorales bacterium]|nr:DNA polymerase III subunit alpha [Nitriliruptorales bacterium]
MVFAHLAARTCYSLRDGVIKPRALAEAVAARGMEAVGIADHDGLYGAVRFADACARTGIRPIFAADLTLAPSSTRPGWNVTRPGPTKEIRALATAEEAPGVSAEGSGARPEWAKRPFPPRRTGARPRPYPPRRSGSRHPWLTGSRTPWATNQRSWTTVTPMGPSSGPAWLEDDSPRVVLIARTQTGYANLCRTVTEAHLGSERSDPHLTWEQLERWAGRPDSGLYVLLADDSPMARLLDAGRHDAAAAEVRRWMDLVSPANVLIGITHHLAPGDDGRASARFALADRLGLRAVAHQAPRYLDPAGARIADVLEAIRLQVPLSARHATRRNTEGWLKDPSAMAQVFAERPDALRHAADIADTCRVDLGLGRPRVPDFAGLGERAHAELTARCRTGMGERYPRLTTRHHDRLGRELAMVAELGLSSYFLTVADIVDRIREKGIMAACRGSAASSIIAYALRISDVDPIAHDLVFERFMNPYRDDLPDIDIDVESARREDIYRDLLDRYGSDRVACVCMVETFKARMAIREVGKALGLPAVEVDSIAKSFPHVRAGDVRTALEHLPEMRGLNVDRGQVGLLFDIVERMDGFPRHIALHPSGVLLADTWLRDCVPLERSAAGFAMAQFDKDDVEALGMCKLDLLGVRMLSSMAHCVAEVRRTRGVDLDIATVPWNDEPTYELIRSTRTLGMFQIESPGQRELIGKFQPEHVGDLIVDISLFRPGPVKGDMVGPFLQRRLGQEETVYPDRLLEEALGETFGVIVYHEQVMEVIAALTGCDLSTADLARRRLGAPGELSDMERWVVGSAVERGVPEAVARSVWKTLAQFASFGFCKAHAAAFAVPTYRSAWLKRHYLPEFVAGLLTHDPGMYPRRLLLDDARQFGVCVLPLDVNLSARDYRVERVRADEALGLLGVVPAEEQTLVPPAGLDLGGDPQRPGWRFGIRLGLQDVVGIDDRQIESLLVGRPFTSVGDLRRRASLRAPVAEALAHAGALDDLGGPQAGARTRRDLLLEVTERWSGLRRHQPSDPTAPEQLDLLGDLGPPGLAEYRPSERVRAELEVLGLEASRHLITFYDDLLDLLDVTRTIDLLARRGGERVRVAGVKVATQTPPVKSGQRIIFLSLDDATGVSDATFFESVHDRCAWTVFHTWLLMVEGTVHRTGARGVGINAEAVWDLRRLMLAWREGWLDEAVAEAGRPHAEAGRDFSDQAPRGTQGVPGRSGLGPDPRSERAATGLPARDDLPYHARGPAAGAFAGAPPSPGPPDRHAPEDDDHG